VSAVLAFVTFPRRRRPNDHHIVRIHGKTLERKPAQANLALAAVLRRVRVALATTLCTEHVPRRSWQRDHLKIVEDNVGLDNRFNISACQSSFV
jgi:hypothetical protein